ncbi:MAG: hypothetical protein ABI740_02250 [Alphaproteobacteria bacterium]
MLIDCAGRLPYQIGHGLPSQQLSRTGRYRISQAAQRERRCAQRDFSNAALTNRPVYLRGDPTKELFLIVGWQLSNTEIEDRGGAVPADRCCARSMIDHADHISEFEDLAKDAFCAIAQEKASAGLICNHDPDPIRLHDLSPAAM